MIGQTLSHYRVVGHLGRGGMGIVYRAHDVMLDRPVALKFLPPDLMADANARQRLIREARAAAALDHQSICPVYDIVEAGDQLFIAMALLEGETLRERIARGAMPIADAVRIAREVAEGLKAAHGRGIVHRDIKPGNIMLAAGGATRILDFGLARIAAQSDLTRSATVTGGTIAYMSPEQARGEAVDHRTDLWSLGCVVYEMLTGVPAFPGDSAITVLRNITESTPRAASSLRPEIPAALSRVLDRCLAKDPRARFPDAGALVGALAAADLPAATSPARGSAIAVLPFVDMSRGHDQEYFCDGIAEELINALAHVSGLRVVARTSAFAFKGQSSDVREIGRRLDVTHVLEGSMRTAGNRLRITAQLVQTSDGCHVWSDRFDRSADDIFEVQDQVAAAVVQNLRVTLLADERERVRKRHTNDAEAYRLYLKGTHFAWKCTGESFDRALPFLTQAVARDAEFALAYAGMSRLYSMLATLSFTPPRDAWPKSRAMLAKALALDGELAEAHALAGQQALHYDFDLAAAEDSLRRALSINPGMAEAYAWLAWVHLARCRFDRAADCIKRAQGLDPLMLPFYTMGVGIDWMSGRYESALEEFERVKEIDPTPGLGHFHAAVAHFQLGHLEEAEALMRLPLPAGAFSGWPESLLVRIAVRRGRLDEARRQADALIERGRTEHVSSFTSAMALQAIGEHDRAFEFYSLAFEQRDPIMVLLAPQLAIGFVPPDDRFAPLLRALDVAESSS